MNTPTNTSTNTCRAPDAGRLYALSYLSTASAALQSPRSLAALVSTARRANLDDGVTGAIACENGQIRQWIEGPQAAVTRLWDRIRLDPRHRVAWAEPPAAVSTRHFPGSPLKLALSAADLAKVEPSLAVDAFTLPHGDKDDSAGSDGDCLSCTCRGSCSCGHKGFALSPVWQLDAVFRAQSKAHVAQEARRLTALLTGSDLTVARMQVAAAFRKLPLADVAALAQAVLAALQMDWAEDETVSLRRQVAVSVLQSGLRDHLDLTEVPHPVGCALVSIWPGAIDPVGGMIKAALLRQAQWSVRLLLPRRPADIADAARWMRPDLVVLAGSDIQPGAQDLPQMARLLPLLRTKGHIPVIVGGALARTDAPALHAIGAQGVCTAMAEITALARPYALTPRRSPTEPRNVHKTRSQCTSAQVAMLDGAFAALADTIRMAARDMNDTPPGTAPENETRHDNVLFYKG